MEQILGLSIEQVKATPEPYHEILIDSLDELTVALKDPKFRNEVPRDIFHRLKEIMEVFIQDIEIITRILRIYRILPVNSSRNQAFLFESSAIQWIIQNFVVGHSAPSSPFQVLGLQVVGNAIAGNPETSSILISAHSGMELIISLLEVEEDKVRDYAGMVGLSLSQSQALMVLERMDGNALSRLLDHVHLEFIVLWLESLASISGFIVKVVPDLDYEYRVKFLHALSGCSSRLQDFPKDSLVFLISNFKTMADQVLSANPSAVPDDFNVLEITASVELFCKLVQNEELVNLMKGDRSLVISTIVLLQNIHEIGSKGTNCFSPIEKLEDFSARTQEEPGFLFKSDLIRLIGILVEDHRVNQNQVRELGALPVILTCTRADGKNPFITECGILTLKLLLDGNEANQSYIKKLQKTS